MPSLVLSRHQAQQAVDELLAAPLRAVPPSPPPVAADLSPLPSSRLSILCVGRAVPDELLLELQGRRCAVLRADTLIEGWVALSLARYDAVAVAPHVETAGDGVRFARALKHGRAGPGFAPGVRGLAVAVLPLPGDDQFAVFRADGGWYLASSERLDVAAALVAAAMASRW